MRNMKDVRDNNGLYCEKRLGIRNAKGEVARRIKELAPAVTEEELLSLPLDRGRFLVVDLETTGMNPKKAGIIEIGAVEVDGFTLGRELATLVNPGITVPGFISSLTGIKNSMLIESPGIKTALPLLKRMMNGRVLVAHNLKFDLSFLQQAWRKVWDEKIEAPTLCTVKLSRRVFPELASHNLDSVASHLSLRAEAEGAKARHRALGDARMAAAILVKACMMLRGEGVENLADLVAFQSSRRSKKKNRKAKTPA
jgi:DNA polymerase-3 subunit epsilon